MAERAKSVTELPTLSAAASTDLLVIIDKSGTANTKSITVGNFLTNSVSASVDLLKTTTAPANSTATGTRGGIRFDNDYLYVCIAANSWKRIALTEF